MILLSQQIKPSLLLEKKLFPLIFMHYHIGNYHCFFNQFYHKMKIICKKGATCTRDKQIYENNVTHVKTGCKLGLP